MKILRYLDILAQVCGSLRENTQSLTWYIITWIFSTRNYIFSHNTKPKKWYLLNTEKHLSNNCPSNQNQGHRTGTIVEDSSSPISMHYSILPWRGTRPATKATKSVPLWYNKFTAMHSYIQHEMSLCTCIKSLGINCSLQMELDHGRSRGRR